ncbi:hypothetical protein ACRRTK_024713 [Alexandromys fortis]
MRELCQQSLGKRPKAECNTNFPSGLDPMTQDSGLEAVLVEAASGHTVICSVNLICSFWLAALALEEEPQLAWRMPTLLEVRENLDKVKKQKLMSLLRGSILEQDSHINRRTQFENPVLEAKRKLQQHNMPHPELGTKPLQAPGFREKPLFTRDASQLKGTFLSTTLKKSNMGFGFTIIGGDEPDEFLQVKSVIPDGPAAQDGKMETGTSDLHTTFKDQNFKASDSDELSDDFHDHSQFFQSIPQLESAWCLPKDYMETVGVGGDDLKSKTPPFTHQTNKYALLPQIPLLATSKDKISVVYFYYPECQRNDWQNDNQIIGIQKLKTTTQRGDVIVYINEVCVLGHTHADVVKLFQSVPIGQSVNLVLCRGYPLPFDPEDPASSMVPPLAIMERPPPLLANGRHNYETYLEYISRTSQSVPDVTDRPPHSLHSMPADGQLDGTFPPPVHDDNVSMASSGATQAELMTLTIVKGAQGFGFTIADSPTGQRVKQILDVQGCPGLCEGDLIVEINQQNVQNLSHTEVVDILKDCPVGSETSLVIHRGGQVCRNAKAKLDPCDHSNAKARTAVFCGDLIYNRALWAYFENDVAALALGRERLTTGSGRNVCPLITRVGIPFPEDSELVQPLKKSPGKFLFWEIHGLWVMEKGNSYHGACLGLRQFQAFHDLPPGDVEPAFRRPIALRIHCSKSLHYVCKDKQDITLAKLPQGVPDVVVGYSQGTTETQARLANSTRKDSNSQLPMKRDVLKLIDIIPLSSLKKAARSFRIVCGAPILPEVKYDQINIVQSTMDRWETQGSPQTSLSAPAVPQNLPFPPALHRSSFPDSTEAFDPRKPDPYELYEKSRAIYESRLNRGGVCSASHPNHRASWKEGVENDIIHQSTPPESQESDIGVATSHKKEWEPRSPCPDYKELDVHLRRMESGFGFRILGGDEPGQPILIGAVIAMGSADRDGRLHPGDELVYVDGIPVAGKTHRYVIDLMHHAARNGQVNLTVRRKVPCGEASLCAGQPFPKASQTTPQTSPAETTTDLVLDGGFATSSPRSDYATYANSNHAAPSSNASPPEGFASHSLQTSDVVIHRKENEGFGFVIISSLNRPESGTTITVPHKIGRIIDGSPADRCAKLKVGDRILAVNGQSIVNMPHADIVKLVKDAGLSVTLRIIPQEELNSPVSAPSSEKQSPMAQQHSPLAQPSPATPNSPVAQPAPPQPLQLQGHENRSEVKARQDVKPDIRQPPFTDYRQPPLDYRQPPGGDYPQPPPLDYRQHSPDTRQYPLSDYRQPQDFDYFTVDMEKGAKGFGFSIRGGREYKMDLYVLRLAEDGPAIRNGRMRVPVELKNIRVSKVLQGLVNLMCMIAWLVDFQASCQQPAVRIVLEENFSKLGY